MSTLKDPLPQSLRKYFWDCNFDNLSFDKYAFFITERILNYGNMDSLKWLFDRIDKELMLEVLTRSKNLNKKTKNYWATILVS